MSNDFVLPLKEAERSNIQLVGGKAASLGEMINAGLNVPRGFVLTTKANRLGMTPELERLILASFSGLNIERVAVRSSAVNEDSTTASWAGQLESYLDSTEEELIKNILKCWRSANSDRAIEYAKVHNIDSDNNLVAVIIQEMVDSDISGVLFTANPINHKRNEIVIEAVQGLGELLVQGNVTPEMLIADKSGKIKKRTPSTQKKKLQFESGKHVLKKMKPPEKILLDSQVKKMAAEVAKIEKLYDNVPQDIEWAVSNKILYILQSRPITTLVDKQATFTFEKTYTREESLILVESLAIEVDKWLIKLENNPPPSMFFRMHNGLTETWLGEEATQTLVEIVYGNNVRDPNYLLNAVDEYKNIVKSLAGFEARGRVQSLTELSSYLRTFKRAIVPIHIIFFTPLHEKVPKNLYEIAVKARAEDALFDHGDVYVRDSLVSLFPELDGYETYVGLQDLDNISVPEIRSRYDNFIWSNGSYLKLNLTTFQSKHKNYIFKIEEPDNSKNKLEGLSAYSGTAEGKAQIILKKKQVAGFKKQNVLVAPMTTPHYLPAMQRAVAFVTDEGGITSHAAIVARELKKPCVIGTKFATQIFKNGDTLKVNAYNGTVVRCATSE